MIIGGTKGDIIKRAYNFIGINPITAIPTAEELETGLTQLELMASDFLNRDITVGYNFEDEPDLNSQSQVPRNFQNAFEILLGIRLLPYFGKMESPTQIRLKNTAIDSLLAPTSLLRPTNFPPTMPRGSGNRKYGGWFQRYFPPVPKPPVSAATVFIVEGDINDYKEVFTPYLGGSDEIQTYTVENTPDASLIIVSSSTTLDTVSYRLRADRVASLSTITIKITTTLGRQNTQFIYFQIRPTTND